jgi:hypothetical protein
VLARGLGGPEHLGHAAHAAQHEAHAAVGGRVVSELLWLLVVVVVVVLLRRAAAPGTSRGRAPLLHHRGVVGGWR